MSKTCIVDLMKRYFLYKPWVFVLCISSLPVIQGFMEELWKCFWRTPHFHRHFFPKNCPDISDASVDLLILFRKPLWFFGLYFNVVWARPIIWFIKYIIKIAIFQYLKKLAHILSILKCIMSRLIKWHNLLQV